jgi:hypothetical protein
MARKKATETGAVKHEQSKSAWLRDIIAEHPDWTVATIRDYCERQGRPVSPALASKMKYRTGDAKKQKYGRRGKNKAQGSPFDAIKVEQVPVSGNIAVNDLLEVGRAAKEVGGVPRLKAIVDALCACQLTTTTG